MTSVTEINSRTQTGEMAGDATAGDTESTDSVDLLIAEVRSGKRLQPGRPLRGAMLIDRDLSGLNLAGADLSRANLTRANLVGASLEGAVLFGATLDHAELLKANLRGADLTQASASGAGFGGADLEEANLFNARLTGATFTQANLKGVDARTADVSGARFRECCLHDADCSQSVLCETDLGESDVTGATFEGADLRRSKLSGLRGATEAVYWVWWATSDCGRSFVRWGLWTATLAVVFALAYQFGELDLGGRPDNWMTTIYFSFVTLTTLGYGDIVPTSATARIVALIEVVIGYMMLGGLLGIFANKMARRAE